MNPKFVLTAFVVGILFLIYGVSAANERIKLILTPQSTQAASFSHEFLISGVGSHFMRYRVDALGKPELFAALFPGYPPEMAKDRKLWENYFSREFETKIISTTLSKNGPYGFAVHMSFTGCLDILKKYGADVLIVGASDTAQAIPPDELALHFRKVKKRILMCASPSMTAEAIHKTMNMIAGFPRVQREGIETVIFGLSTTLAFVPSLYYPAINRGKLEIISAYRQASFLGEYGFLNRRRTIPWSWNEWIPSRRNVTHLPLPNQIARKKDLHNPERWSVFSFQVTRRELQNVDIMNALREKYAPVAYFFSGNQDPRCERMEAYGETLRNLRGVTEKFAKQQVFFLTPSLRDELNSAPDCFLPYVTARFKELDRGSTMGVYMEAAAFGLNPTDFAFVERDWKPDEIRVDMGHLNIKGARQFTAELMQMMQERFELR